MLPFYSFKFVLLLAAAVFFYRAGKVDGSCERTWAALSVLISVTIWGLLHGGIFSLLLGQICLFVAITLYRSRKGAPPPTL